MKTSDSGRSFLIAQEGKTNISYPDPVSGGDPWTIGVGHTGPDVVPGLYWSDQQVDDALVVDLASWENYINSVLKVDVTQNQFDALVSFSHNLGFVLGHSTLLRKLNSGDVAGAADQFLVWNQAGGRYNSAIYARRQRERALFLRPDAPSAS